MADRISEWIFETFLNKTGRPADKNLTKKLIFLNPCEDTEKLYRDFSVKRIKAALLVIFSGVMLIAFTKISLCLNRNVEGNIIERNEWDGEGKKVELTASYGEMSADIGIKVESRTLSEEEIEKYTEAFEDDLPYLILGENEDLNHVSSDLELKEKYDGYPFQCEWRSSDTELIRAYNGKISTGNEGEAVLTVIFSLGEFERSKEINIRVCKPIMSDEEFFGEEIRKAVMQSELEGRNNKEFILPENVSGHKLRWEYRQEDNSLLLGVLFLIVGVVVYGASEKDLERSVKKKKKNMLGSYPRVLREMSLYVGAGMTVKAAFKRIAEEGKQNGNELIFEEMRLACNEMNSGISEGECYERFGNRTGLGEYIKFAGLLSQTLRRGNPGFKERLRDEARLSMKEKALKAKRSGEEAQTKMLAPMMMMLAVVMVMIMIPAMTGMNI